MIGKTAFLGLVAVAAAQLGASAPPAPAANGNTPGVVYAAKFDGKQGAGITGYVTFTTNANGTGNVINVNLDNLPNQSAGPFLYHIHQNRVPENGNCTGTGAHLDPQNRGEMPPCDANNKASCQVGDLAGKYGKMSTSPWQQVYIDLFTSTDPSSGAFFGNRSITIHDLNTTRIACANIEELSASVGNGASDCSAASGSSATLAPFPTGGSSSGSAQPSGAAQPSGSPSYGGGSSSGSGSGSSAAGTASGATGTPVPPKSSSTITASNSAAGKGMATGAVLLAALAFML